MKILYIAHRIPYPPNKGDKIRSFNEVKYLSKQHDIDLICLADNPDDLRFKENLEKYCRRVFVQPFDTKLAKIRGLIRLLSGGSISAGYFYLKAVQKIVNQWLSDTKYDAVICFSSPMAEYLFRSNPLNTSHLTLNTVFIMDFCDLDSDKWRQYSAQSLFPLNLIYRMEYKRLLEYEKKINAAFDHSVFVSGQEAELFYQLNPKARNVSVIANGVDSEYFCPKDLTPRPPSLKGKGEKSDASPLRSGEGQEAGLAEKSVGENSPLRFGEGSGEGLLMFAGAMDYHANIDGVQWFCKTIFPAIQAVHSDAQFYIVGSKPAPKVVELGKLEGVTVTGFVEDIRPYYHAAQICVIPLRLARGVQNKVLEAMSVGKAVVTTSAAIRGISPVSDNCLMVADTPEEFAEKVLILLENADLRKSLGKNAREFVQSRYDWQTNMNKFVIC
ncbi:MAG: glycosyl transferase (group I) [Desulfobacteraceae bacterium IS3]|nr:MAG: glycosyl transferase (group I) [Desulfobacteraceae bacterium IS3]